MNEPGGPDPLLAQYPFERGLSSLSYIYLYLSQCLGVMTGSEPEPLMLFD